MSPQDISYVLREFSPKRRTPPSDLLGETQRRFIERYGYWPSSMHEISAEFIASKCDEALGTSLRATEACDMHVAGCEEVSDEVNRTFRCNVQK
jgi:hypothetical protein